MAHNSKRRRLLLTFGALVFGCARPAYANEQAGVDPAVARVRAFYDSLLTVMKQAKELGIRGRYEKLAPANRKLLEGLQTAVSSKNTAWLEAVVKQLADKRTKGEISSAEFQSFDTIILRDTLHHLVQEGDFARIKQQLLRVATVA